MGWTSELTVINGNGVEMYDYKAQIYEVKSKLSACKRVEGKLQGREMNAGLEVPQCKQPCTCEDGQSRAAFPLPA